MRDDKAWMRPGSPGDGPERSSLDTSVAYSARVNNYWQSGKDNFAADRAAAEQALAAFPGFPAAIRAGRPVLRVHGGGHQGYRHGTGRGGADAGLRPAGRGHPLLGTAPDPDSDDPYRMVSDFMDRAPAGSYLVIAHPSSDIRPEASAGMAASLNESVAQKRAYGDHGQVSRFFFTGLDLVQPGVVPLPQWRPDSEDEARAPTMAWAGVGRKP